MAEELLNGREPLDWELPALERGRRQELERDSRIVAGLLTEERDGEPARPRPVTDLPGLS